MAWRPHGHARVDPHHPEAFALCDDCQQLFNLVDLRWQFDWRGNRLTNLRVLKCRRCLDKPFQHFRPVLLPPDPVPVVNARPENFNREENDFIVFASMKTATNGVPLEHYTADQGGGFLKEGPGTLIIDNGLAHPGLGTGNGFAAIYITQQQIVWPNYVVSCVFTSLDGLFPTDANSITARGTANFPGHIFGLRNDGVSQSNGVLFLTRQARDPMKTLTVNLPAGTILPADPTTGEPSYVLMLSCFDSVITGSVMRLPDFFWLDSQGRWQTIPKPVFTVENPNGMSQSNSQPGLYQDQDLNGAGVMGMSSFLVYVQGAIPVP